MDRRYTALTSNSHQTLTLVKSLCRSWWYKNTDCIHKPRETVKDDDLAFWVYVNGSLGSLQTLHHPGDYLNEYSQSSLPYASGTGHYLRPSVDLCGPHTWGWLLSAQVFWLLFGEFLQALVPFLPQHPQHIAQSGEGAHLQVQNPECSSQPLTPVYHKKELL